MTLLFGEKVRIKHVHHDHARFEVYVCCLQHIKRLCVFGTCNSRVSYGHVCLNCVEAFVAQSSVVFEFADVDLFLILTNSEFVGMANCLGLNLFSAFPHEF